MMHYSLIGYVIACSISLFLCWLAYRIFLESKVSPQKNRIIIMSIFGLMFLTPFFGMIWPSLPKNSLLEIETLTASVAGGEVELSIEEVSHSSGFSIRRFLLPVYLSGMALFAGFMIMNLLKLRKISKNAIYMEIDGTEVYIHNNKSLSSYSWFDKIFLYHEVLSLPDDKRMALLIHERAHIKKRHYIDLIIAQIIFIFQWFNPAAWLFRGELQRIHEYEADSEVLKKGIDEIAYQTFLIDNITRYQFSYLIDGLNNCALKKRIIMMQKGKFKKNAVLRAFFIMAAAIGAGSIISLPAVANNLSSEKEMTENNEETFKSFFGLTDHFENTGDEKKDIEKIYVVVEEMAKYGNEDDFSETLINDLAKTLRYTKETEKNGKEGRVIVKFVVRKDGKLDNFKIVRSVDPELDQAAIECIKALPKQWIPGKIEHKAVDSYFTLPVSFKL